MKLSEFEERIRPFTEEIIGKNEEAENLLNDVIEDYRSFESNQEMGDWKLKYLDLKEKYVNRFFSGDEIKDNDVYHGKEAPEHEPLKLPTFNDIFEERG